MGATLAGVAILAAGRTDGAVSSAEDRQDMEPADEETPTTEPEPDDGDEVRSTVEATEEVESEIALDGADASGATSDVSEFDAVEALHSYMAALDAGDLALAYEHISPALRQVDLWSWEDFSNFWRGRITGASVVSVDDVWTRPGAALVEATLDYVLADGTVSREQVRARFVEGEGGDVRLDDYEVLSTDRL